jgi:hypothetical protein
MTQSLLLGYGPMRIICLSTVGHSAGSDSALWAAAQNCVKHCGSQERTSLESNPMCIHWLCIHVHMVVYPHAWGRASTCTLPFVHAHVAMDAPQAEFGYVLWAKCTVLLSTKGHSTEVCYMFSVTAHNFVLPYGPQHRISLSAMSHVSE